MYEEAEYVRKDTLVKILQGVSDTTSKKSLVTKRITVDLFIDREASSPA